MKILFVLNRLVHVRHFDRAVRLLADRGHDVCLASQEDDTEPIGEVAGHARITMTRAPQTRSDDWQTPTKTLRRVRDYLRYLHPRYADARPLRYRAFEEMVSAVSARRAQHLTPEWSELLVGLEEWEQRRLDAILAKIESAVPSDPDIRAFLAAQRPDLLVLSPMVGVGYSQADFVKSARELQMPSGMLVFSWDNLSNKGLIHERPDRMWVWNDIQRDEAVTLHNFPADNVVVTGAARFDAFFEMRPAIARDELCAQLGLDAGRPILTYLCSSKFVAPHERSFVDRWIARLRNSGDPALQQCNVIVRPHPAGVKEWHAEERSVIRWPRTHKDIKASASHPFDDRQVVVMSSAMRNADQVLYDTLHHSAAVVGLNTSAEIEAAIVGRPVCTVLESGAEGQKGTLHFRYLLKSEGGHVEVAETLDQHADHLSDVLAGRYDSAAIAAFVKRFVRPLGLEQPVSPILADAIEAATARTTPATVASLTSDL